MDGSYVIISPTIFLVAHIQNISFLSAEYFVVIVTDKPVISGLFFAV